MMETELRESAGASLQAMRTRRGMTQSALSKATGISLADISRIEHGRSNVTLRTLQRLAEALSCLVLVTFAEDADAE